jgi:hypothetical protein
MGDEKVCPLFHAAWIISRAVDPYAGQSDKVQPEDPDICLKERCMWFFPEDGECHAWSGTDALKSLANRFESP